MYEHVCNIVYSHSGNHKSSLQAFLSMYPFKLNLQFSFTFLLQNPDRWPLWNSISPQKKQWLWVNMWMYKKTNDTGMANYYCEV